MNKLSIKYLMGVSMVALSTPSAIAQDEDAFSIEEIVITAQKRAESLQDVPVSVTALAGNTLQSQKILHAGDISAQIPNLQAANTSGDGFPIFSLRGVNMSDFSLNQSSPVASYVDEVYKGVPALQGVQIYDLERIEVLRGPQGTLYGKNSTGGAVNFITKRPTYETEGYISVGYGNNDRKEIIGAVQMPLIDGKLAVRIAGTWTKADGWQENLIPEFANGNAVNEYGVRATFLFTPSDNFEALLRLSTGKQNAVNYGILAINNDAAGVGAGVYGLYQALGGTNPADDFRTGQGFFEFTSNQDEKHVAKTDSVSLTMNWDVSDALTVTSITSYDDGRFFVPEDADGTALSVIDAIYIAESDQFTQDLRITSDNDGPFNFIAGLYYGREDTYNSTSLAFFRDIDFNLDGALDTMDCLDTTYTAFGLGQATASGAATEAILNGYGLSLGAFFPGQCASENEFNQLRTSKAGYFDGNFDVTDKLSLNVGVRYTEDKAVLSNYSARLLDRDGTPLFAMIPYDEVNPYATIPDREFTDSEWTGKVSLDYKMDDGSLFYASYSKGFRAGAYNAQAFYDVSEVNQVEPEKLDSFEVGFKTRFLDERVQLNASLFSYNYKNQQFLNVDPVTVAQTLVNIDKSSIKGLEVELVARPSQNLLISAGLGLLDSEVKSGSLSGIDLSGNKLILAPSTNFNIMADWDFWSSDSGTATLKVDGSYISDHYFEIFNIERMKQEGYWLANARLEYRAADDQWAIGAWVKNMFEKEYIGSAIDLQGFGYDYTHIGQSRSFGIDLTYNF